MSEWIGNEQCDVPAMNKGGTLCPALVYESCYNISTARVLNPEQVSMIFPTDAEALFDWAFKRAE